MGKSKTPAGERRAFVFSYNEHEWSGHVKGTEAFAQRMLLQADIQTWDAVENSPSALAQSSDPEITNLSDLRSRVEQALTEGAELPPEIAQIPFKKLKGMMKRDGWHFVSGTLDVFEGNHNDTEIRVVLEKT